jgi:hypothetical protein
MFKIGLIPRVLFISVTPLIPLTTAAFIYSLLHRFVPDEAGRTFLLLALSVSCLFALGLSIMFICLLRDRLKVINSNVQSLTLNRQAELTNFKGTGVGELSDLDQSVRKLAEQLRD